MSDNAFKSRSFVCVHGGWHSATIWRLITPLLEQHGHIVRSLDLPGAGSHARCPQAAISKPFDLEAFTTQKSEVSGVTQKERTLAVTSLINEVVAETNEPVILVGHSWGGHTITSATEAVPDKLLAVVYLSAFMLPPSMTGLAMIQHPTMGSAIVPSLLLGDPAAIGALRMNPKTEDSDYLDRLKAAFFGDLTDAQFRAAASNLHCDEPLTTAVTPTAQTVERFGSVPRHYIRCLEDCAITPEGQLFMIDAVDRAIGGRTNVHELQTSHSPFYSQPRKLAELLLGIEVAPGIRTGR